MSPTSTSRIVATASVNVAAKPGDAVSCYLELGSGGNFTRISSGAYFDTAPGQADVAFPVVGAAADRPAGTYTVRVQCDAIGGTSSYAAGDLVVVATG